MRIGLDMDGVIADFDKGWVDRYNADFNANLEYKQCDYWDSLIGITHFSDYDQWWNWAQSQHEDLFLNLEPLPGAQIGVNALKQMGHDIVIITSKPRWAAGHPSSWLIEHDFPYDEIHVTSQKQYVICDVYVDDAIHNIKDFLAMPHNPLVIQYFAWPYVNRGIENNKVPGAVYCNTWASVVTEIMKWEDLLPSNGRIKRKDALYLMHEGL